MELLKQTPVICQITAAVFVPAGGGVPVHRNRKAHGLAFNVDHMTTYRFADGKTLVCQPGQCIYLPKGADYTVDRTERSANPGAGVYAINFQLLEPDVNEPCIFQVRGREEMLSCFQRAVKAWRQRGVGFSEECFIDLYKIIKLLKKEVCSYAPMDKARQLLEPALRFIDANYTEQNISVSYLAELCGVSQPYLRKLFQVAFSVSPAVYMRNLRLDLAKELLRSGEYSVTQAAVLSGFNDTAYFSREFKKFTGVSPQEYGV